MIALDGLKCFHFSSSEHAADRFEPIQSIARLPLQPRLIAPSRTLSSATFAPGSLKSQPAYIFLANRTPIPFHRASFEYRSTTSAPNAIAFQDLQLCPATPSTTNEAGNRIAVRHRDDTSPPFRSSILILARQSQDNHNPPLVYRCAFEQAHLRNPRASDLA